MGYPDTTSSSVAWLCGSCGCGTAYNWKDACQCKCHEDAKDKRIAELESRLAAMQALVNEQAEDVVLRSLMESNNEGYVQKELRRLHRLIEEGK